MTHPPSTVIKNPTWWRRRTHLERILLIMTVVAILLCVALITSFVVAEVKSNNRKRQKKRPFLQTFCLEKFSILPNKMDPLLVFPPEIVQSIWNYLSPQDLLPARAVSTHWLASIGSCPSAWVTDFSNTWHEFLHVKKTIKRWKSKRVRREEISGVRDFVPTEHAYYVTYNDGTLSMFHPDGYFIRIFHTKVHSLHVTEEGLLICTHALHSLSSGKGHFEWNTLVTDYPMNVIDEMYNVQIIKAFTKGFYYRKGDDHFLRTRDWEIQVSTPLVDSARYFILCDCYVVLRGTVHTSVWYGDHTESDLYKLHEFKASPLFIPAVQIRIGPGNWFAVFTRLMHFSKIFLYDGQKLIIDTVVEYNRSTSVLFTPDHFLVYHRALDIYPLNKVESYWSVEIGLYSKIMRPFSLVEDNVPIIANSLVLLNSGRVSFYRIDDGLKITSLVGIFEDVDMVKPLGCTSQYVYSLSKGSLIIYHFELT